MERKKKCFWNPYKIFESLAMRGFFKNMNDKEYLSWLYRVRMGRFPDLNHPKSFNEKLQWLKLNDRKPEYTEMVDKYLAKKYVEKRIGEKYIIPTLGVWDEFDQIEFEKLPDQFVLKTTHDSGGVVICKDKANFDKAAAKRKLEKSLKRNYYWAEREWPYKNVKPRIIAENYLSFLNGPDLVEYKVFCFNGKPALFLICKGEGHTDERTNDFYDLEFNHIPVTVTCPNAKEKCQKPDEYEELLELSRKLAKNTYQLRVDLYVINHKIYFGELTLFHDSGCCKFNPPEWDKRFGDMLKLPIEEER